MVDYNAPDTSKGDFYCVLCDSRMNCIAMWESHKIGKRHLKNLKKPPNEAPSSKTVRVNDEALIMDEIFSITDEPFVGLDYISETRKADSCIDPFYNCLLCQSICIKSLIIDHLLSEKHRLAYLRKDFPEKFALLNGFRLAKHQFEPMLKQVLEELEIAFGSGTIEVKIEKTQGKAIYNGRMLSNQLIKPYPPLSYKSQMESLNNLESKYSMSSNRIKSPPCKKFKDNSCDITSKISSPPHSPPTSVSHMKRAESVPIKPLNTSPVKIPESKQSTSKCSSAIISSPTPDPPSPKPPTPEPEFELDLEKHSKYLGPNQINAIIESVQDDLQNNPEGYKYNEEKRDILLECFKLKFTGLAKACYEQATPEQKKIYEFTFSKQGEEECMKKKLQGLRIPGVTKF